MPAADESSGRSFDVAAFLDRASSIRFSFRTLILCGLLAAVEGMDQYIVATTLPALAATLEIQPAAFATVFVLQALGMIAGTYGVAPLADRFGRRPVILVCALFFGVLTAMCSLTASLPQFVALRAVSFVFIGGALPNLFAMAAEFASARNRQRYVLLLGCVHGLGAGGAGVVGARLLVFGWQAPFVFCGGVTLLTVLAGFFSLPESVRFLAVRPALAPQLETLLRRIEPDVDLKGVTRFQLDEPVETITSVSSLFAGTRSLMTVQLWIVAAMCIPILGTVGQWMPTYFHTFAGYAVSKAAMINSASAITAVVWPFALMFLMDRMGIARALALSYLLAFVSLLSFAWIGTYPAIAWGIALGFGAFAAGSVSGYYALCARAYPTAIRSTGLGWAIGAGRMLSIFAPALGGVALARHTAPFTIAITAATPMLIAALVVYFVRLDRN